VSRVKVLVVDDKENMLKLFAKILAEGYELTTAGDGARAMSLVATEDFDVVVTDIRMPGASGFEVLKAVKARQPSTEVLMMTGYGTVSDAVQAMKLGAYDYLEKPFDPDAAALVVQRAAERKRLKDEAASLRRELEGTFSFHNLIGKSPRMLEAYRLLEQAATLDITVLLGGETGTGKELAARAVHYHSARKERRFVPVNCGALPPDLIESELFGHARGAFSGAVGPKAGLFEEAQGGTIFLDEVGELPLPAQVKLNRALQEHEIRRVGDNSPVAVDVRVIAATHRELKAEVAAGRFREDLYYRLNVFPIRLPALRERTEDVPLLAAHFLEKYARAFRRAVTELEPDALRVLTSYGWPGNVRELENAIERAVLVGKGGEIAVTDLPETIREESTTAADFVIPPHRTLAEIEKMAILQTLQRTNWNKQEAAQILGLYRPTLYSKMKKHEIRDAGKSARNSAASPSTPTPAAT